MAWHQLYYQQDENSEAIGRHDFQRELLCGKGILCVFLSSRMDFEGNSGNCVGDDKMIKEELIRKVSAITGFQIKDVREIINEAFRCITGELLNGNSVNLNGFGVFYTKMCTVGRTRIRRVRRPKFKAGESLNRIVEEHKLDQ